jgi:hypothetical protein
MENSFLKASRACHRLANTAAEFTKSRLLDLAAKYDDKLLSPFADRAVSTYRLSRSASMKRAIKPPHQTAKRLDYYA